MDRKNTMLLTVIAVATLLVAVVGATFAYFSLTVSNTSATTNVNVSAKAPDKILLTGKNVSFKMKIGASEMTNEFELESPAIKYYAVPEGEYSESGTKYSAVEKSVEIADIKIDTEEEVKEKYTCNYTVVVKAGDGLKALLGEEKKLKEGDLVLTLKGPGIGESSSQAVDLSTLATGVEDYESDYAKKIDGTVTLTSNTPQSINASLYLQNRNDDQSYLYATSPSQSLSLDVSVIVTGGSCQVQSMEG